MVNRILQKIKFRFLQSEIGSYEQFKKVIKFDGIESRNLDQNKEMLRPYYEYYVREVSRADMAASLELMTFMYTLCKLNHYTKLLDMGSGLSSFVFRLYAKENSNVRVFSVDDDAAWLEKTKDFLRSHQLGTENIFMLDQFLQSNENEFDCILHDLNFVEVRINYVDRMMEILNKDGVIIFDDVHKPDYLFSLLEKLKGKGAKMFDLRPVTIDNYRRFALAAVKD